MTPPLTRWQMAMGKSKTICQCFVDVFPLKFSRQYFTAFLLYVRVEFFTLMSRPSMNILKAAKIIYNQYLKELSKYFSTDTKGDIQLVPSTQPRHPSQLIESEISMCSAFPPISFSHFLAIYKKLAAWYRKLKFSQCNMFKSAQCTLIWPSFCKAQFHLNWKLRESHS